MIDAPTQAIIVPYGEGKEIITTLCSVEDNKEKYEALAKAQRYSVNVFPKVWRKLVEAEALQETQAGSGIYYLDERHYLEEYGLCTDRAGNMTCYDF